jgi:hypothetical protein
LPIKRLLEDNEAGEMALELGLEPNSTLPRIRLGDETAVLESEMA